VGAGLAPASERAGQCSPDARCRRPGVRPSAAHAPLMQSTVDVPPRLHTPPCPSLPPCCARCGCGGRCQQQLRGSACMCLRPPRAPEQLRRLQAPPSRALERQARGPSEIECSMQSFRISRTVERNALGQSLPRPGSLPAPPATQQRLVSLVHAPTAMEGVRADDTAQASASPKPLVVLVRPCPPSPPPSLTNRAALAGDWHGWQREDGADAAHERALPRRGAAAALRSSRRGALTPAALARARRRT